MSIDPKELKRAEESLKKINTIYRELGKAKLELNTGEMAELPGILQEAKSELADMNGTATNLYEQLRGVTMEIKGQVTPLGEARKGFRDITKAADALLKDEQAIEKLNLKQLTTIKQKAAQAKEDIQKGAQRLLDQNDAVKAIEKEIAAHKEIGATQAELDTYKAQLIQKSTKLSDEEKAILAAANDNNSVLDEIIKKATDRANEEERIEKAASGYSKTAEFITSLPGLKAFAKPFQEAAAAAKEAARDGKSAAGIAAAASKEIAKSAIVQGISLAGVFTFVKNAIFGVNTAQTELGKQFGISSAKAKEMYNNLSAVGVATGDNLMTAKNLMGAQSQLADIMGTQAGFSKEQLISQTELTKRVGIQEQSAAKLGRLSMASGMSTEDALNAINKQNVALKLQTGITLDNRGVIEEVAQVDGQIAANYANNPKLIAKAVMQTRKLGLNLKQAKNMASGLLDFESSIEKEMEAELLLGRDLNFDRARSLALQGDSAGAAAEIAKQVGTIEKFSKLTVIEQQALAEAAGMTADELANSLTQTANLNKLGGKQKKELQEQVKLLREQGRVKEANALMSAAGNEKELADAQKKISMENQLMAAKDMLIEKVSMLITQNGGLESIVGNVVDFFSSLPTKLSLIKNILAGVVGVMVTFKMISLGAAVAQALIAAGAIATASALSMGIGIAAVIGGIVAGGLALKAMSSSAESSIKDGVIGPGGETIVSGPKGSVSIDKDDSMIVGTNLFGKSKGKGADNMLIAKIDQLIRAVEKGGDIYMDGSKVGSALALGSKLSS